MLSPGRRNCPLLGCLRNAGAQECFFGAGFKDKAPKSLAEALSTPVTGTLFASGREHQGNRCATSHTQR